MFEIAAFGNPLLDITVRIYSDELIKKHNLKEDDQIDIGAIEMLSLYKDIITYPNHISAGGCAQNTMRVLQWLLQKPNMTVYFGAVGKDELGNTLNTLVHDSGLTTKYLVHDDYTTGTCIALVRDSTRTLVAHLGAAQYYNIPTITCEVLKILKHVKICYMEGFFLVKRVEVAQHIKNLSLHFKTVFAFNLSGAYLFRMNPPYPQQVEKFAKNCDILFGNRNEFAALGEALKIEDPKEVAIMLNKTYRKKQINSSLARFGKIVVMTNGDKDVFCVYNSGEVLEMEVISIPSDDIEDTTGAGDSFVSGFLAGLLMNFEIEKCLKFGCWTSSQIIQQKGCTVPDFIPKVEDILRN